MPCAIIHSGMLRSTREKAQIAAPSPIVAPGQVPWGQKALGGYLGPDRAAWRAHDAVALIEDGTISSKIAKEVFDHVWNGQGSPSEVVEKHGLKQVTDTGAIERAVDEIMAANPDKAAVVAEKPQAIGWFVGQVMKATGGKANPAAVNDILKAKLGL